MPSPARGTETDTRSGLSVPELYRLLEPITVPATSRRAKFINWGLSFECTPLGVFEPETEEQCALVLELARREGRPVRAAGVGHSPSDLACTSGFMLRTEKLCKIIEVSARPGNLRPFLDCSPGTAASRYGHHHPSPRRGHQLLVRAR
jgi:FAD/FMN-containing dehydrogenase